MIRTGPGLHTLHQEEEVLQRGPGVLHMDIPENTRLERRGCDLKTMVDPPVPPPPPRMLNSLPPDQWCQVARAYTTWSIILAGEAAGQGGLYRAVLHNQRVTLKTFRTNPSEDKSGSVYIVPEDDPANAPTIYIHGIVLSSYEAVFHHYVAKGIDAVTVCSPSENLHPANISWVLWIVSIYLK